MVRSSEIGDCTMLFMFTSARKRNSQRNFSFITKGTELLPRFRVFCGTLGMSISWQVVGEFCSQLLWLWDMVYTRPFQR